MKISETIGVILQAAGLGMGAAVLVLRIMNGIPSDAAVSMLAIGLFAVSIAGLRAGQAGKEA